VKKVESSEKKIGRTVPLSPLSLIFAYALLLIVMFVLPFYSVDEYFIIKNTTSHLGAQQAPNAWIMNLTFIIVGMSCVIDGWSSLKKFYFHKVLISIFGIGIVFTGIFRHAPIVEGIMYNSIEDQIHSIFATIVGFSFVLYAISSAFIEKTFFHRAIDIVVSFVGTFLSIMMFYYPDFSGIWQRAIFIVSFMWLIFMFERIRRSEET